MSKEKVESSITVSLDELLANKNDDFKVLLWEDNGAIKKGYAPHILSLEADLDKRPAAKQFSIFQKLDGSCCYTVEVSGVLKKGEISETELKQELGSKYDTFITALQNKHSHGLQPFLNNLFNIQAKKGQPINDTTFKEEGISEFYKDANRAFCIYQEKFSDLYNASKSNLLGSKATTQVEKQNNIDKLIKHHLQVSDEILNEFKDGYPQDISSVAAIPFMHLSLGQDKLDLVKHIEINLYKTPQGRIAARTEMDIQGIATQSGDAKVYGLKAKIEVDWESNAQGELQLKSMRISGPHREIVSRFFKDNEQNIFLSEIQKLEVSEAELIKESLICLQKLIDLQQQNKSIPASLTGYINQVKNSLKKDLPPETLLNEIKAIDIPRLSAKESENKKNGSLRTVFINLSEAGNSSELNIWINKRHEEIEQMTNGISKPNLGLRELINEEKGLLSPADFIEKIGQRWNAKEILVEAAKMDKAIYQEIVAPAITFSSVLRKIGEFFGIVKPKPPRPELTMEDHLAVFATHPDLLEDPEKNEKNKPYQKILQNASPEKKLRFSPNYLTLRDKLSLLSEYANDPSKTLASLGEGFFFGLDQQMFAMIDNPPNKADRRNIYNYLTALLLHCDFNKAEAIRCQALKNTCSLYESSWLNSPASILYRLKTLMEGNDAIENEHRFGRVWASKLVSDLDALPENKGFNADPRDESIQSIIDIINDNEVLYNRFVQIPGYANVLNASFTKPAEDQAAPLREKEVTVKPVEKKSVVLGNEVEKADNKAAKSVENASDRVGLAVADSSPHSERSPSEPIPILKSNLGPQ